MTRIYYHRSGKNFTSNYMLTYEGKKLIVFIHHKPDTPLPYTSSIIDDKGNVLEFEYHKTASLAKYNARSLLINKYNVRIKQEIRS